VANLSIHGNDAPADLLFHNRRNNCGRKQIHDQAVLKETFWTTHYKKLSTTRCAAKVCGISESQFRRLLKAGFFKTGSSHIKPKLSPVKMEKRVEFANQKIITTADRVEVYDPQYDTIYWDEKWFYECPVRRRFYLCDDEDKPQQFRRNKQHLTKVIFLSAVARPWKTANPTAVDTIQVSEDT
jgi:hypothetical protein